MNIDRSNPMNPAYRPPINNREV